MALSAVLQEEPSLWAVTLDDGTVRLVETGPFFNSAEGAIATVQAELEAATVALAAWRSTLKCSPLQGRLVLGEAMCAAVDAIAADPETPWAMRETILRAVEWQRTSEAMDELSWLLDVSAEEMDALFSVAVTVAV